MAYGRIEEMGGNRRGVAGAPEHVGIQNKLGVVVMEQGAFPGKPADLVVSLWSRLSP